MFICPAQTKEHESVITTPIDAETVHTALLAIGAKAGSPVQFQPEYKRATGAVIDIVLVWVGEDEKVKVSLAQDWIKKGNTRRTMQYAWIFGGSGYWKNPNTNEKIYYGNDGSLVCLSNFPTATMDLPVESSNSNEGRLYQANTSKIAPLKTHVRIIFVSRPDVDATKIPKVRIGTMSLIVSEKKPTAVVIEVIVIGRANFSSINETAFSRGCPSRRLSRYSENM